VSNLFSSYWFVSAIYSLAQRFAIAIFGLLSFLMLIRVLSVEYMSYWSIYLLIISLFESIKTNLIKNAFIKYYIQSKTDNERLEVSSSAFMVNLALSIVFVLFILLFS